MTATLSFDGVAALAARLATARLAGATLTDVPRLDLATGWRVQAALAGHLEPALGAQCGWKLGATSAGAMQALGVERPIIGRLFASRLWHGAPGPEVAAARDLEAEPEVILQLDDDLEPCRAWLGIEFNRPALADPFGLGAGAIVADNAASFGVLCRHRVALPALQQPERIGAALRLDGEDRCRGHAADVLDGPLSVLPLLKAMLADDPRGLRPGDYVATGAMCRSIRLPPGAVPQLVRLRHPSTA